MVVVKLPNIMFELIAFQNVLPRRLLEWLIFLVGYKIKVKNGFEAKESKNILV